MNVIPEGMLAELARLQELASKVRGFTPVGHENRLAGDLLAEVALDAMSEYKVTATELSQQMGLNRNTMQFFLMRRGAVEVSPGMAPHVKTYTNTKALGRTASDQCSRGHDTSTPETRYSDGNCKVCTRERQRGYYAKKKAA